MQPWEGHSPSLTLSFLCCKSEPLVPLLTRQYLPLGVPMQQTAVDVEEPSWLLCQASRQVWQCEPDNPHPRLVLVSIHNNPTGLHVWDHRPDPGWPEGLTQVQFCRCGQLLASAASP